MRVKVLVGDKKRSYQLVLPVASEVRDLAPEIQSAIEFLGRLHEIAQVDLAQNPSPLYRETMDKIHKQGAYLWKTDVRFEELISKP